jgi:hypothetical protein
MLNGPLFSTSVTVNEPTVVTPVASSVSKPVTAVKLADGDELPNTVKVTLPLPILPY